MKLVIFETAIINEADKNAIVRQLDEAAKAGITEVVIRNHVEDITMSVNLAYRHVRTI